MGFNAHDEATILVAPDGKGFSFHSNPGSGPVADADLGHAITNAGVLVKDVEARRGVTFHVERKPELDDGGRYGFRLFIEGESHDVEIPGLPAKEVRWLGPESGDIWHFPRLYVDGSSWVWKYAILEIAEGDDA